MMLKKRTVGYLSAAPRVSTKPSAEASGPRSHVLGVINAFKKLNWEVYEFIVGDQLPDKVTGKGSEQIFYNSIIKTLIVDLVRLCMGIYNANKAYRLLGNKVEWVYERFAVLQTLGFKFKKKNIPWILETNAPLFIEAKQERKSLILSYIAKKMEFSAYEKCDVLVCVSEELKNIIVDYTNIDPNKVIVVPNGVDIDNYNPQKYKPIRLFEGFNIGFVGSLIKWQAIDLLIYAVKDLREQGYPINVTIVGDGPQKEEWENLSKEIGVANYIKFTGRVPPTEVPKYIKGFDICYSGQLPLKIGVMYLSPLKLYEYMSMGKPVIASSFSDAKSLIEGKDTGYLFEPGNLEDLKNKIIKAYSEKEMFSEMGKKAREEIVLNHSWEKRVEKMIKEVEIILGRKK